MTESTVQRKARGAFFTPPAITRFLADWAVRSASDRVLEPSCGEAEFLLAAGARIRDRGAGLFAGETLHGIELHAPSAEIATQRVQGAGFIADIFVSDFFDVAASRDYNAVIGNPPYVRYQDFTGEARAKALRAALEDGVRLNGLASAAQREVRSRGALLSAATVRHSSRRRRTVSGVWNRRFPTRFGTVSSATPSTMWISSCSRRSSDCPPRRSTSFGQHGRRCSAGGSPADRGRMARVDELLHAALRELGEKPRDEAVSFGMRLTRRYPQ